MSTNYQTLQRRREALRWLVWVMFIGGCILGVVDMLRGLWLLSLAVLLLGFSALALLPVYRSTEHLSAWSLAILLPYYCIILYAVYLPTTSLTVFVWVQTIPVYSYMLLGKRGGFIVSSTFLALAVMLYYPRSQVSGDGMGNIISLLNLVISSVVIIGFAHIYEGNREIEERRLIAQAGTDPLTGLANRLLFVEEFERLRDAAKRHKLSLTVALIDLDHFKSINDKHGHATGDEALKLASSLFSDSLRKSDLIARYGGEEFAIAMLDCSRNECIKKLDAIRKRLNATPLPTTADAVYMSFSAGVAVHGQDGAKIDTLMDVADRRLYQAKESGRNRVLGIDPVFT